MDTKKSSAGFATAIKDKNIIVHHDAMQRKS
jgi:hypothetical protein